MNSHSIRAGKVEAEDAFKELAREIGAELSAGNSLLRFSGEMGHGQIKKWHLDIGLYMRVWDLHLSKPVEFVKEALPVYVANNGFTLLCIQTPESVDLKGLNLPQQFNKARERRFMLVPDSVNACLQFKAQTSVQLIEFSISAYWLKQQPGYIAIARYFDDGVMEDNGMPVMIEPCSAKANEPGKKLISSLNDPEADTAGMLCLADALIKDFLTTASAEENDKTSGNIDLYYEKIKEAEAILLSNLQKSPPRMSVIARMVALSESTLKRYFKLIYGKSVYEYYLNRKMELARTLLLQQPCSVNEMAELMGYEKVSHFIEIFKKHHGCSPGSIRKKVDELIS